MCSESNLLGQVPSCMSQYWDVSLVWLQIALALVINLADRWPISCVLIANEDHWSQAGHSIHNSWFSLQYLPVGCKAEEEIKEGVKAGGKFGEAISPRTEESILVRSILASHCVWIHSSSCSVCSSTLVFSLTFPPDFLYLSYSTTASPQAWSLINSSLLLKEDLVHYINSPPLSFSCSLRESVLPAVFMEREYAFHS